VSRHAHDVVVIGASAGGVEALGELLANLPADLPAAIAITLHRRPVRSPLAEVLGRRTGLPIVEASEHMPFLRGRVHLAPPDQHMRVDLGFIGLDRGPKQHYTRPAIDPLFASAAAEYGARVLGVLLTGNLSDGSIGMAEIKAAGGLCLVQRPGDASFPSMPESALFLGGIDYVFDVAAAHEFLIPLVSGRPLARR
jgi:two-component system chemotaxis response regulator CheB